MSKLNFVNGTVVLSAWLNKHFGQGADGGHKHDGVDDDGHLWQNQSFGSSGG